jgi:hypothetical protein
VKTSYALTQQQQQLQQQRGLNGEKANAMGSLTLDDFLSRTIQAFLTEAQRENDVRDPRKASRLGKDILVQLQYLVMVDQLAERPSADGGLKWFIGLDEVYPPLEEFAKKEAGVIASYVTPRVVNIMIYPPIVPQTELKYPSTSSCTAVTPSRCHTSSPLLNLSLYTCPRSSTSPPFNPSPL